jgi:Kef-type K+ transport system membrane component KefB
MAQFLTALAVVMLAARFVGAVAVRFRQPRVVGEIVAGVLIGPSALGALGGVVDTDRLFPAPTRASLGVVGQLGLLLFMLLVGLGFDPAVLAGRIRAVLSVAVAVVVLPVAAGFALLPVLFDDRFAATDARVAFALFVGAMLSVTAFPVMVRILEERSLHLTPFGVVAIAAAAVVTVLMFVVTALARSAIDGSTSDMVAVPLEIIGYLVAMLLIVRPILARMTSAITALSPTGVLAVVMIITLVSGRLAVEVGLGVIVGGFVAGLVIPGRHIVGPVVSTRLADLVGVVLLPVFLANSGLVTDLTTLGVGVLPGLALFLVVAVVSKWVVGTAVARLVGLPAHEANALGILMNCRGLLVLVVGLAALEAGVITPQMQVGSVLVALVTTAMTGPLFSRAMAR